MLRLSLISESSLSSPTPSSGSRLVFQSLCISSESSISLVCWLLLVFVDGYGQQGFGTTVYGDCDAMSLRQVEECFEGPKCGDMGTFSSQYPPVVLLNPYSSFPQSDTDVSGVLCTTSVLLALALPCYASQSYHLNASMSSKEGMS